MTLKSEKRPVFGSFNHIAVEVDDLPAALYFYENILGLNQQSMPAGLKEKGIYWLDLGNGLALHLVKKQDPHPGATAHIAIAVDDVGTWQEYLNSRGVNTYQPQVSIYNAERIFFTDPSGNRIEFVKWL